MDHKTWLWRKKSTDKVAAKLREDELNKVEHEKAELESVVIDLRDKLSDALSKIYSQDDLIKKHELMAADSMSGWEDAEAKVFSLKQELDEASLNIAAREERMAYLESALKECTQQLHLVRDEQEQRIHDAVMKTTAEWQRSELVLKQKLEETTDLFTKTSGENSALSNALLLMEQSAESLSIQKARLERECESLSSKLESCEKDNDSLGYEIRLLQKELEIRNEEREFNQKIADSSHKKHLESVKKVAKVEAECQRLRVLVRKRLPGPAALAKMRSEVEALGRDGADGSKRRLCSSHVDIAGNANDATKISLLKEQLWTVEEENKFLKEALNQKTDELQFSKSVHNYSASKQSQVESSLQDFSRLHGFSESPRKQSLSQTAKSDISVEDSINSCDSWPSALISELEHFKSGNQCISPSGKTIGSLDINLMDDFAEVERLASVSAHKQSASRRSSAIGNTALVDCKESELSEFLSDASCKDIGPERDFCSETSFRDKDTKFISDKPDWLQSVLKIMLKQHRVTSRHLHLLLDDVRSALNIVDSRDFLEGKNFTGRLPQIANDATHLEVKESDAMGVACGMRKMSLDEKKHDYCQSKLEKSLGIIIELIERFERNSVLSIEDDQNLLSCKSGDAQSDSIIQVFQWKASELRKMLKHFIEKCHDFLNSKCNCYNFVQDVGVSLGWVMNHCISIQDVESFKDVMNKSLSWNGRQSESEAENIAANQPSKIGKNLTINGPFQIIEKNEKSHGHVLCRSKSENGTSEKSVTSIENQKLKSEPCTSLEMIKAKLNDSRRTLSCLDEESDTRGCSAEPESPFQTQNQLESVKEAISVNGLHREEKQLRTDLDISVASEKLAQCQQTIEKLGKQLKGMTSSTMEPLLDKAISSPTRTDEASVTPCEDVVTVDALVIDSTADKIQSKPETKSQKSSLLERMREDERANRESQTKSAMTKPNDNYPRSTVVTNEVIDHLERILMSDKNEATTNNSKAIVQSKKKAGVSLWRRLFWRRRRSSSKKPRPPFSQ